jgi:hypothetical protein
MNTCWRRSGLGRASMFVAHGRYSADISNISEYVRGDVWAAFVVTEILCEQLFMAHCSGKASSDVYLRNEEPPNAIILMPNMHHAQRILILEP